MTTADRRYPAEPVTRPSVGRAAALVLVVWAAAFTFVLTVAADTRIGPVVFKLTKNHGVHLGDLYATLASAVVAILITVWIVVDHLSKQRRYDRMARRAAAAEPANPEPWPAHDERDWYADDDHGPDEHRPDDHEADDHEPDEHRADEHRADEDRADEDRADEDRADEDRADEHRADEHRADEHRADEHRADEHRADEDRADPDLVDTILIERAAREGRHRTP